LARQISLELRQIETENIQSTVFNLRSDVEDVSDLERSIADKGLIEPIVVRELQGKYQLICGHRRLQACRNLGWEKIRAVIANVPDKTAFEMAITENVQRSSLDPYEEAEAFRRYVSDYGWGGVSELARKIGKSEDFVSHRMLLLDLPPSVRVKVGRRLLSVSQASELVWLKNVRSQEEVADKLVQQDVSFRDTRRIVKLVREGYTVVGAFDAVDPAADRNDYPEVTALKQLRRGILSCRSSLFVLDSVIDQLQGQRGDPGIAATVVLEQRVALHGLIDRLITEKVRLERKIRKQGL
jgi:ParB family chromosome partitioning protein